MIRLISVALLAATVASMAPAQSQYGVRVGLGIFYPSQSFVRDAFGDQWTRFSLAPGSVGVKRGFSLDYDVQVLSRRSSGNRLFIFSPTVGFSQTFGEQSGIRPYFASRIGAAYADYRIGGFSEREFRATANFELGFLLSERLRVYGRYDTFAKRNGLDFSGFSVNAELMLFSF